MKYYPDDKYQEDDVDCTMYVVLGFIQLAIIVAIVMCVLFLITY
jgi:hypothetical protein